MSRQKRAVGKGRDDIKFIHERPQQHSNADTQTVSEMVDDVPQRHGVFQCAVRPRAAATARATDTLQPTAPVCHTKVCSGAHEMQRVCVPVLR